MRQMKVGGGVEGVIENFCKVGNDELKRSRLRRPVLCVLGRDKETSSIFNISVGNCLCNKFSSFLKGNTFQMKHGSVPLVVNSRHDRSRMARWAPLTKDLLPLPIRWKDKGEAIPRPHCKHRKAILNYYVCQYSHTSKCARGSVAST